MKLSKIILILISSFVFINAALSQEKTIEPKTIARNSEKQVETILNDFSLLNWKSKEKEFPLVLDKIEQVKSTDEKDLLLARLYTIFPGKNDVNLNKAPKLIENYLNKHPESHEGYLVYARLIIEEHEFKWFRYVVAPNKQEVKENIKQRKNALINIEKSLKLKKSAEGYQLKAELSEGEEKIELLETSISLDPNYNEAWRELIRELSSKHRYDEALSKLSQWMSKTNTEELAIEIYKEKADVYRSKKEFNQAIQLLKIALSIRIQTGSEGLETLRCGVDDLYFALAKTYLDAKDNLNAEEFFKKYLELNPKDWWVRFDLAKLYQDTGENNKSIVQYEQVLAYNENNTPSIYNLGLLYEKIDEKKSKELFIQYIKLKIDKDDEESIKWVERAKSKLRSMDVYDYPASKKELKESEPKPSGFSKWLFLLFLIPLAWKYKKTTRFIILSSMTAGIVFISFIEADSSAPSLVKAFLYFIPIICTGTFLLYIFRKQQ